MSALAAPVVMFGVFLAIYFAIQRRTEARTGVRPRVQWGWLVAIAGCAAGALVLGALLR